MARKTLNYTVTDANRDQGKVFVLTEMAATPAERWANRLIFGLMNAGVDIPENVMSMGMAGLAVLGVQSLGKLPFHVAEPLLDEMFGCVQIMPDASKPNIVRHLIESDIEEVITRMKLRKEILMLHIAFFTDASPSTQASAAAIQTNA